MKICYYRDGGSILFLILIFFPNIFEEFSEVVFEFDEVDDGNRKKKGRCETKTCESNHLHFIMFIWNLIDEVFMKRF